MSRPEAKPKQKPKKTKGESEMTVDKLRSIDELNTEVNEEMKRLGLDFDINTDGKSVLEDAPKDKSVIRKGRKDKDSKTEQDLLWQQFLKLNLSKHDATKAQSSSKTSSHKGKNVGTKSQKVVLFPESTGIGNSF